MNAPQVVPVLDEIAGRVAGGLSPVGRRLVRRRVSRFNPVHRYLVRGFFAVEVELLGDTLTVSTDDTCVTLVGREAVDLAPALVLALLAKRLPADNIESVKRVASAPR